MFDSELLTLARDAALRFLTGLPTRRVRAAATVDELRASIAGPLPAVGLEDRQVVAELERLLEPGLVASAGPRYFGFVTGGTLPAALAAEWLTTAWDQNAFSHVMSPAASVVEEVAASWLLGVLGLPAHASVGFVTGGQMANFTCLAAARFEVLRRASVDVEETGLHGAPEVRVFVGEQGHVTIATALRLLGFGTRQVVRVSCDDQGRMLAPELAAALQRWDGPAIVCTQAGNVSTGSFDPLREIIDAAHARGAWVHIDGAFGLWAAAHPELRKLAAGFEAADSWAIDGHKWLNVSYDSGFAIVADPRAHKSALRVGAAAYLVQSEHAARDGSDWVPESSRRARGIAVYAALRSLGRRGVAELVERCCTLARRIADGLAKTAGATILNDVVLNQVLVRFDAEEAPDTQSGDTLTRAIIERVQRDGVCWAGPSTYGGRAVLRISISNWSTTERDVDLSVEAIATAARACRSRQ
jgi:glutamate/tyrosine decarboxylase-like PLP-dependent enzyme